MGDCRLPAVPIPLELKGVNVCRGVEAQQLDILAFVGDIKQEKGGGELCSRKELRVEHNVIGLSLQRHVRGYRTADDAKVRKLIWGVLSMHLLAQFLSQWNVRQTHSDSQIGGSIGC